MASTCAASVLSYMRRGQVSTERLTAILNGIGVAISKRHVVRLLTVNLDAFAEKDLRVLQAGLQRASFLHHGRRHERPPCTVRRRDNANWRRALSGIQNRPVEVPPGLRIAVTNGA